MSGVRDGGGYIDKKVQKYNYIYKHILPLVNQNEWQAYVPIKDSRVEGPFHRVAKIHWQRMKDELQFLRTVSYATLKCWANYWMKQGHPILDMTVSYGGSTYTVRELGRFTKRLGDRQHEQRVMAGFNTWRNQEEPLPDDATIHDACVPSAFGSNVLVDVDLYVDPNSTEEDAKLARVLFLWINTLRTYASQSGYALKLAFMRKNFGLMIQNGPYYDWFLSELERLNIESSGRNQTYGRNMYSAVYRLFGGKKVDPRHLEGANPSEKMKSILQRILGTNQATVFAKFIEFIAGLEKLILDKVLGSEDWMEIVASIAAELKKEPYYRVKLERILNGEGCMIGDDCELCVHELLLCLLSDLHHFGEDGMKMKKELNGKNPADCSKKELDDQANVLRLICKAAHRVLTGLDLSDPKKEGHDSIPKDYTFEAYSSSPTSGFDARLRTSVNKALTQLLLELPTHNKCMIGGSTDQYKRFGKNVFDCHHIAASHDVEVTIGEETFTINTKKCVEISKLATYATDKTYNAIFEVIVCEVLKCRSLECARHLLWHFLYSNREHPLLKPLFEEYWPFVEKRGRLKFTGDTDVMLTAMDLKVNDLKDACNDNGYLKLPISNNGAVLAEGIKRVEKRKKKLRNKRCSSRGAGLKSDDDVESPKAEDNAVTARENESADVKSDDNVESPKAEDTATAVQDFSVGVNKDEENNEDEQDEEMMDTEEYEQNEEMIETEEYEQDEEMMDMDEYEDDESDFDKLTEAELESIMQLRTLERTVKELEIDVDGLLEEYGISLDEDIEDEEESDSVSGADSVQSFDPDEDPQLIALQRTLDEWFTPEDMAIMERKYLSC